MARLHSALSDAERLRSESALPSRHAAVSLAIDPPTLLTAPLPPIKEEEEEEAAADGGAAASGAGEMGIGITGPGKTSSSSMSLGDRVKAAFTARRRRSSTASSTSSSSSDNASTRWCRSLSEQEEVSEAAAAVGVVGEKKGWGFGRRWAKAL